MELSNLSRRDRITIYIAGIALILLCGVALYRFVLAPDLDRYFSARTRYYSQQEENKRAISRRDTLLAEYVTLRTKFNAAQRFLFSKIEADDWLEMLPVVSTRSGNDITALVPQDSRAIVDPNSPPTNVDKTSMTDKDKQDEDEKKTAAILAGISEMPVSVGIRGKYSNIINLFDSLEKYKQLMVISEFSVSRSSKDTNQVETNFQLNLIHINSNLKALPIEVLVANQTAQPSNNVVNAATQKAVMQILDSMEKAAQEESKLAPQEAEQAIVEKSNFVYEVKSAKKPAKRSVASGSRQSSTGQPGGVYSIRVGVFSSKENADEVTKLMKSKNYDPWIKYDTSTKEAPNQVYIGRFKTKKEADRFGELMKKELPWTKGSIIEKTK
jgi:DedD protein